VQPRGWRAVEVEVDLYTQGASGVMCYNDRDWAHRSTT
jgi:hypothetical protein